MSALLPTFVTILVAEVGGNLGYLRHVQRPAVAAGLAGLMTGFAAAGSAGIVGQLTPEARLLLLAMALILAGLARFARMKPQSDRIATLPATLLLWRSTAPFTVFALSIWLNDPVGAALGGLAGLGAAAAIPPILPRTAIFGLGALLTVLGALAAISGLRLV